MIRLTLVIALRLLICGMLALTSTAEDTPSVADSMDDKISADQRQQAEQLKAAAAQKYLNENYVGAVSDYMKAAGIYSDLNDESNEIMAYHSIATVFSVAGQPDSALHILDSARAICRQAKDSIGEVKTLKAIGQLRWQQGDTLGAGEAYASALEIGRDLKHSEWPSGLAFHIGISLCGLSAFTLAQPYLNESLAFGREIGSPLYTAQCLRLIGRCKWQLGDTDSAMYFYEQGMRIFDTYPDTVNLLLDLWETAPFYSSIGRLEMSLALLDRALEVGKIPNWSFSTAHTMKVKGMILIERGSVDEALSCFETLLAVTSKEDEETRITAIREIGSIYCTKGDLDRGRTYLDSALAIAEKSTALLRKDSIITELRQLRDSLLTESAPLTE